MKQAAKIAAAAMAAAGLWMYGGAAFGLRGRGKRPCGRACGGEPAGDGTD